MPNINFEDDTRHDISNKALARLEETMHAQDDFGVNKYGKSLRHDMPYNWLHMAREELADMIKYLECEELRKEQVVAALQLARIMKDKNKYIDIALSYLTVEGTGK